MSQLKLLLLGLGIMFLFSCTEDPIIEDPITEALFDFQTGEGYFILNEGGFGKANASVSYYHIDGDSLSHNIFEQVNGKKLGDVLQSAKIHNDKMYLVVNNSGYIKIVDINTFEEVGEITGFTSPRYMQIVDKDKAYVSDLFAKQIWVIDLNINAIIDSIQTNAWTEEMIMLEEKVFVTSPSSYGESISKSVFVIDSNTDELTSTISLKANPVNILVDDNGAVQVFCQGDPFGDPVVNPSFHTINPSDLSDKSFFNMPGIPVAYHSRMDITENGETIYLLYGGVFEIEVLPEGLSYANIPLVEADGRSLYGISTDPVNNNILVSDAKDYNQPGSIYEYKNNGVLVAEIDGGIVPSNFLFY